MTSFWIGVIITLSTSIITYSIIDTETLYHKCRSFLIWLPFNISISFWAGFATDIVVSKNNEFGRGIITVSFPFIIALLAVILERNHLFLRTMWEDQEKKNRYKGITGLIYVFLGILSMIPFFVYNELTGKDRYILLIIGILLLLAIITYNSTWRLIYSFAQKDIETNILNMLYSVNRYSYAIFTENHKPDFYFTASRKELDLYLETTEKALGHIYYFDPLLDNGNLLPGLSSSIVSPTAVKKITENLLDSEVEKYHIRRAKLFILVGDDAQCREGYDIIKNKFSEQEAESLTLRRAQL